MPAHQTSSLPALQARAEHVRQLYAQLNAAKGHKPWAAPDFAMGFVGDVGELMELVMVKDNLRSGQDTDAKLAHELSDCLWSILVLAQTYGVDLESAFHKTMDQLEAKVQSAIAEA